MSKVALVSLGCAKNLVDSEVMLGLLAEAGHTIVEEVTEAETIIVNTCAFIESAKEEAIEALLELSDLKAQGTCRRLICAGCLAQRYSTDLRLELPEVDAFAGTDAIQEIVAVVEGRELAGCRGAGSFLYSSATPRLRAAPQWSAYLKIAEGCDHECTFCAIPAIRGPQQSRPPADILAEYRALVAEGVCEVNLIAQDTSAYGRDLGNASLEGLLRQLDTVEFDGWLRVLYMHPAHITPGLLAALAEVSAVVPYVDIPLQHAAPSLLEAMGRPGSPESHLDLLQRIREALPAVAIRTTFLVGFPGETEEDFDLLCDFVTEARFDRLACFAFSREEDTPAHDLPAQVAAEVARERLDRLMELQEPISLARNTELVGGRLRVLLEDFDPPTGGMKGRSYRDAPEVDGEVIVGDCRGDPGDFVEVLITAGEVHDLRGQVVRGQAPRKLQSATR